jgi:hypothetical protein
VLVKRVVQEAKVRRVLTKLAASALSDRPTLCGAGTVAVSTKYRLCKCPVHEYGRDFAALQTAGGIYLPETGKKLNEGEVRTLLAWCNAESCMIVG